MGILWVKKSSRFSKALVNLYGDFESYRKESEMEPENKRTAILSALRNEAKKSEPISDRNQVRMFGFLSVDKLALDKPLPRREP